MNLKLLSQLLFLSPCLCFVPDFSDPRIVAASLCCSQNTGSLWPSTQVHPPNTCSSTMTDLFSQTSLESPHPSSAQILILNSILFSSPLAESTNGRITLHLWSTKPKCLCGRPLLAEDLVLPSLGGFLLSHVLHRRVKSSDFQVYIIAVPTGIDNLQGFGVIFFFGFVFVKKSLTFFAKQIYI